jgi:hypothetical protein
MAGYLAGRLDAFDGLYALIAPRIPQLPAWAMS